MKVAVLMSTFNGEKYIREQIKSVFSQKGLSSDDSITLYVRDDSSDDSTQKIIKEMQLIYPIQVLQDSLGNIGYASSFMQLLYMVTADFYFFCDQDDIWGNYKVSVHLKKYRHIPDKSVPFLSYTDMLKFGVEHGSHLRSGHNDPQIFENFRQVIFEPRLNGCLMGFNNKLKLQAVDLWFKEGLKKYFNAHDTFLSRVASLYGEIWFIDVADLKQVMNYRVEGQNISGVSMHGIVNKIVRFQSLLRAFDERYSAARRFLKVSEKFPIDINKKKDLRRFLNTKNNGFVLALKGLKFFLPYQKNLKFRILFLLWVSFHKTSIR